MKKLITLALAATTLFSAIFLTSCNSDNTILDEITPTNKWCQKNFEYTKKASTTTENTDSSTEDTETQLTANLLYCDGSYNPTSTIASSSGENATFDFTKKGLFIVLTASSNSSDVETAQSVIPENYYAVLFLEEGKSVTDAIGSDYTSDDDANAETEGVVDFSSFSMKSSYWTTICILNNDIRESATTTVPDCIRSSNSSTWKNVTEAGSAYKNLSWKQILGNILVDKLLE